MNNKHLAIDCVNKIKFEKVEEFDESIFSDVYSNAYEIVVRIMKQNENEPTKEEEFCNENQVANVIAFLGERGMGKSSAMLSFAYFLKTFHADHPSQNYNFIGMKPHFYTLPKIDAAMLTGSEKLLDVVLAEMWDSFSEKKSCGEFDELQYRKTWKSFSELKQTYAGGWGRLDSGNKLQKDSQLAELHMLAKSLNMRTNFAKLVKDYLNAMYQGKNAYLVIPIDDLDLMRKKGYDVLEEIRVLFMIRKVIVLVTADYSRLFLDLNNEIADEILKGINTGDKEREKIREYTENYLGKVLPRNTRVDMPYAGSLKQFSVLDKYDGRIERLYKKNPFDENNVITETRLINSILLKSANILMHSIGWKGIQKTLRDIVSSVNELISADFLKEDVVLQWMRKEISITNRFIADIDWRYAMENLMSISDEQIDGQMVCIEGNIYRNNFVYRRESVSVIYVANYGHVIWHIVQLHNSDQNVMERQMIWLYSLRMRIAMNTREGCYNYHNVFNQTLWALGVSAEKDKTFLNFFRELEFRGTAIIREQKVQELLPNVITFNAKKIIDLFKIMLIWDAEKIFSTFNCIGLRDVSTGRVFIGMDDGGVLEQETEKDKGEEQEIRFKLEIIIGAIQGTASIDRLIENIPNIGALWEHYFHWMYAKIFGLNKEHEEEERAKLEKDTSFNISEVKKWEIKSPEDILPLQNVSVIVSAARKIEQEFGRKPMYIGDYINGCINIIRDSLKEAEDVSMYGYVAGMGTPFSEKWKEIINLLRFDDIDNDVNKEWRSAQDEDLDAFIEV